MKSLTCVFLQCLFLLSIVWATNNTVLRNDSGIDGQCSGENEIIDCGSACDNVCSELHMQSKTNCPIVNIVCNIMCYCKDGYARDHTNKCVPIRNCNNPAIRQKRKIACTRPNEEYTDCVQTCPPVECISLIARFACNETTVCNSGCSCKPGYLREKKNTPCIPICECSQLKNSPECA